jgi:CMP-N-acetylneuraminic acid synthetase
MMFNDLKMTHIDKPICIIPARGGSKRFPRKNISLLAGKPLLAYAIDAALKSNVFDMICVSSEDEQILKIAEKYGADSAIKRPVELATDKTQVKEVCAYLLESFAAQGLLYKTFGVLLVTNPLRTGQDISKAYETFKKDDSDFCMSIVPFSHPPQRAVWVPSGFVVPYFGQEYMKQTQLLDKLYRHDGSIIFAKSEQFLKKNEFFGKKVAPFFMPSERSVDIDSPLDLAWAEFLLERSKKVEVAGGPK